MEVDNNLKLEKEADKIISRYIFQARKFVSYACFRYGTINYLISGEKDARFTYDYEYFAFTKSTKTLISIRQLLKHKQNEDVLILLRSIYENYISCRYFTENDKLIDDFVLNPIFLSNREYYFDSSSGIYKDRNGNEINYTLREPSALKLGSDKKYFYDLYDFLCKFAHCNYSTMNCYIDGKGQFSTIENKNSFLVHILIVFIFSKLFEQVVTVDGEDFPDEYTEKECYKLLKEAIIYLNNSLDILINQESCGSKLLDKHMRRMFKEMKKSLKEEIGSLKKDFL